MLNPGRTQMGKTVEVSAVDNHRWLLGLGIDHVEIGTAEFFSLGDDDQNIGATLGSLGNACVANAGVIGNEDASLLAPPLDRRRNSGTTVDRTQESAT